MKNLLYLLLLFSLIGCQFKASEKGGSVHSPDEKIILTFALDEQGRPTYQVDFRPEANSHAIPIVLPSTLSFSFTDQPDLEEGLTIASTDNTIHKSQWEMPWGEQRTVLNRYNEQVYLLIESEEPHRQVQLRFRAFDDGVAFRYEFLEQEGVDSVRIAEELTQFRWAGDHTAWWIPGDWDIYEHLYSTTSISEIDATSKRDHPSLGQTYIPHNAVNTPVTLRTQEGIHISLHEANLTDYAGMTLGVDPDELSFESILVGTERREAKVVRALPFNTPWRTIQISQDAAGLIASKMILNLNEPNQLEDVSWFKPTKYVGIWWGMHLGTESWDMASGKHGATTENAKRYVDFAAENGIGALLVEGWNTGWEHWIGFEDREGVFDFVTPYEDYDLEEVVRYGKELGVELIMHHETSAAPRTYDQQLDTAFSLMEELGIHAVKTGYVGKIIPKGEYHHGQWMINHYRRVLLEAAKHNVAVNAHEPIKATGLRRTYPNTIAREGLRGQEFNAWSSDGGNPPEHLSIVAFTRMLAGPIDFTPGVFDIKLSKRYPNGVQPGQVRNQVNTTLAHQLALYVVIYSPIQMACDLPEHYEGQPAFQFIRDVGVDWEQSIVLNGEIGHYVTIAREERVTGNWFVGGITDEEARDVEIDFSFISEGKTYHGILYRDGSDAHWDEKPTSISIDTMEVSSESRLKINLAPGGGFAMSLKGN